MTKTRYGQTVDGKNVYMIPTNEIRNGKTAWVEFDIKEQKVINPDIKYALHKDLCKTCSSLFLRFEN